MSLPKRYGGTPDPEKLDKTPVAMPMGACRPTPLVDIIARMVREAVVEETDEDFETAGEADDFEEETDELLDMSPYTLKDLEEEIPIADAQELAPEPESASQTPSEAPQEKNGDRPNPDVEEPTK